MSGLRYSTKTVCEVRRLAEAGWSQRRIQELMRREQGHAPSAETISRWLNPKYAEASRARVRRRELQTRSEKWTFRLAGRRTVEYEEGFIRRLAEEGVPKGSIAKVCTVVFHRPISRDYVRRLLLETTP